MQAPSGIRVNSLPSTVDWSLTFSTYGQVYRAHCWQLAETNEGKNARNTASGVFYELADWHSSHWFRSPIIFFEPWTAFSSGPSRNIPNDLLSQSLRCLFHGLHPGLPVPQRCVFVSRDACAFRLSCQLEQFHFITLSHQLCRATE